MDGSGGGKAKPKRPAAKSPGGEKKPAAPSAPAADKPASAAGASEDPFAIGQAPGTAKAIPCSPKPRKGRLQKVVCPMCETPGFVPKAALGRQVKCANKECLVPIFTAETEAQKSNPRVPTRISEKEEEQRKPAAASGGQKNPLVIYGIVGGVLVALTAVAVWYLNQEGTTELGAVDIPMPIPTSETDEPQTTEDQPESNTVSRRDQALAIVDAMIRTARSNENDQKPLTRRQTGDAYLRLGLPDKAQTEFDQMKVVAERQNVSYYPIVPYVHQYWQSVEAGDQGRAAGFLAKASALKDRLPSGAGVAMESSIALAAALAHSGDSEAAAALLGRQRRDRTIDSLQDSSRASAWWSVAEERWLQKLPSPGVYDVFIWQDPLSAAVASHLAVQRQWDAAAQWAVRTQETVAQLDAFSAIARTMMLTGADAGTQQKLLEQAAAVNPVIAFQTAAVLSLNQENEAAWQQAKSALQAMNKPRPAAFGSILQIIEADRPDLSGPIEQARPLAAVAAAAAIRNDSQTAAAALDQMISLLTSTVPPSAEVRKRALEIDRDSSGIKDRIAEALSLSGNRITTQFIAYRKSIDRFARAAEDRRIYLLQLLSQVVQAGGAGAVKAALADQSSLLAQEVYVDALSGQLYVAAADAGEKFPEALQIPAELQVPIGRLRTNDLPLEHQAIPPIATALRKLMQTPSLKTLNDLSRVAAYPGLRSVVVARQAEQLARTSESPRPLLAAVLEISNQTWRQQNVQVVAAIFANRGVLKPLSLAIDQSALSPSQRVAALHQVARVLAEPEPEASPE